MASASKRGAPTARTPHKKFQPLVSEQDAAWVESVCGHEPDKPFRDANALFHVLLRVGEVHIQRLRRESRAPRVPPGEWTVRIHAYASPERHEQLRRDVGPGPETIYKSPSAYAADLIRMGRILVPLMQEMERTVGRELDSLAANMA